MQTAGPPPPSETPAEIGNIWGFDMLYVYLVPLVAAKEAKLHIVVLKEECPEEGGDAPEAFLELQCLPNNGCRYKRTCRPEPAVKGAKLLKSAKVSGVYGYKVADILEDWKDKEKNYLSNVDFAFDMVKACELLMYFEDHFKKATADVSEWSEEIEQASNARNGVAAAGVVATAGVLLCSIQ